MVSLIGKRVYLDASTVIYALEGLPNYSNLNSGLLDGLDTGAITAISSELTLVETVIGPRRAGDRNRDGIQKFSFFLSEPDCSANNECRVGDSD